MEALRECGKVVSEMTSAEISSVEFASEIHARAYSILNTDDPYFNLKRRSNQAALDVFSEAVSHIESSDDPLKAAMVVSIVGNLMDFGISGSIDDPNSLKQEFVRELNLPLGCDDSSRIREVLEEIHEIIFMADNCGEIVLDKLLLKEIKKIGPKIVLVVKGKPVLTDATKADIRDLDMESVANEIVETEGFAIGMDLWSGVNENLISRMRESELIMSKGMANFEALSEHRWKRIAYLLRAKCDPVADALKVKKDTNIIKLLEE